MKKLLFLLTLTTIIVSCDKSRYLNDTISEQTISNYATAKGLKVSFLKNIDRSKCQNFNSIEEFENYRLKYYSSTNKNIKSYSKIPPVETPLNEAVFSLDHLLYTVHFVAAGLPGTPNFNVNSWISGLTLCTSYNQNAYSITPLSNGTYLISIFGTSSYFVFIENIGTLFSDSITYQFNYNPNTGKLILVNIIP
jgi:hypothetical protein